MIFKTPCLDRRKMKWEDSLDHMTPWENHQGIWFKRDDQFAPLGYGGPNGSKMRQLIWFINRYRHGKTHIVTGASIQSPQLSMTAIVGAHYGLKSRQVVYSTPGTVLTHDNPRISHGFGAEFEYAAGPYNPIIQRKVADITTPESLVVQYGITMQHDRCTTQELAAFHGIGARQTINLPPGLTRLIIPAGSCNTLCSILLGLSRDSGNLKEIFTLGIGPEKRGWVSERLALMGVDEYGFKFNWRHHSLQSYAAYSHKFQGEEHDGIRFHPTYEAKIWRWLRTNEPIKPDGKTGFWIVGAEAKLDIVKPFFTRKQP